MGRPMVTMEEALESAERRWWALVDQRGPDECWPWKGYLNPVSGYGQIALAKPLVAAGWHRTATAPWLGCRLHHGQPPEGAEVLHSCGARDCCNPAHLRWGTHGENMQDRVLHGYQNTGKLTPAQVIEIRRGWVRPTHGVMTAYASLADQYGVGLDEIRHIIAGRTWGWLEQPEEPT